MAPGYIVSLRNIIEIKKSLIPPKIYKFRLHHFVKGYSSGKAKKIVTLLSVCARLTGSRSLCCQMLGYSWGKRINSDHKRKVRFDQKTKASSNQKNKNSFDQKMTVRFDQKNKFWFNQKILPRLNLKVSWRVSSHVLPTNFLVFIFNS